MINFEGVINPLSFGYISYGIAKELFLRKEEFNFFPISNNLDWSSFDKVNEELRVYLNNSANNAWKKFNITDKSFKVWHINDSWKKLSTKENYLLTFHELDQLTDEEVNILNSFTKIFVTSTFSKNIFEDYGVKAPVVYVPMGIDKEVFFDTKQPRPFKDIIVSSIFGKAEKRKATQKTIQSWVSKYGNDQRYKLHCYVTNPFFKPEQMNQVFAQIFNGQPKPFNVDLFPYLPTNSHLNAAYNSTDIVIDMSCGESISLGSLNCIGMGKHGVVHWNSGIKDWSNEKNAVLVKSNGKEPVYDGIFFQQGQKFNNGNIYTFDTQSFLDSFDLAVKRFESNPLNEEGLKLQDSYSFKTGVDIILKEINN
jgi:hypothetical protein